MKISTLIDTNVLVDVWGPASVATRWSSDALVRCRGEGLLAINAIIWSELSPSVPRDLLEAYSAELEIEREHLSWDAAYEAGLRHARYRKAGGVRQRTLPDFLIGAHAFVAGHRLLTRDPARYATYFPGLEIISPDTHP